MACWFLTVIQFPLSNFCRDVCIRLKLHVQVLHGLSTNLVMTRFFYLTVTPLELTKEKRKKYQFPLPNLFIDWLIIHGFTSRSRIFSLIWRRHHCRWKAAKFRPKLGAQGLWAGRDLYRATPAVTRDLGFSGLVRRTAPFSRLLLHTRVCGGSILTRILTGALTF
jgi:hypothetical protein